MAISQSVRRFLTATRWKIWTEDKSKTDITNTKHNLEKANNTKHSKTI